MTFAGLGKSVSIAALALFGAMVAAQNTPVSSAQFAPVADMGTIVFFREKKFAGGGVRYKVREGDVELGRLSSGSYFVVQAAPGTHEYTVHSEAKDILTLEVEAGEIYYVLGGVTVGVLAGRPNLSPSDGATFDAMSEKLKDVTGEHIDND
jgi:hypothetical protein